MGVSGVASLIGTGFESYGNYNEGQTMKAAEKRNTAVSEEESVRTGIAYNEKIRQARRASKSLLSRQGALYAKAGVQFKGSALRVMSDSMADSEVDVLMLNYNKDVDMGRAMAESNYHRTLGKIYASQGAARSAMTVSEGITSAVSTYGGGGGGGSTMLSDGAKAGMSYGSK
jgi:hypothetical protein